MKTKENTWYDSFVEILYKKYPKKSKLTQSLTKILEIEPESVYRRLRKDVLFSANEIIQIASQWNISLDEITGVDTEQIAFQLRPINYLNPSDEEVNFLRSVIQSIYLFKDSPDTEFMNVSNKLPRQLIAGYEYLNKYYLFKWRYQYGNESNFTLFSEMPVSEEKMQVTLEYNQAIKQIPNTVFIWDPNIFSYLVNDIRYFYSIYLITDEDKELIKKDLHHLLDYMLGVAVNGCYPETQKNVNLYISQVDIDTNYNYTYTPAANICFVHAFEKYEVFSFNSEMVTNFMAWMQLKKKTAIQISKVDEKNRINFFMQQKQLIDNL